jgi:hypothetical protein
MKSNAANRRLAALGKKLRSAAPDELISVNLSERTLRLDPADAQDVPILKAFKTFGLNPSNPLHWRMLVRVFAHLHFNRRGRGRPEGKGKGKKIWDARMYRLLGSYRNMIYRAYPDINDRQAAKLITDDPMIKDMFHCDSESLRKRIPMARRIWTQAYEAAERLGRENPERAGTVAEALNAIAPK